MAGSLSNPHRETLRDAHGQVIGYLDHLHAPGMILIRDAHSNLLGSYDPRLNETRDASSNLIGSSNLLALLLGRSR
ncbi:hypothetical protein [Methylorubrum extorquens]|nr:hypothetical protein [Methylorubrum extorquens]